MYQKQKTIRSVLLAGVLILSLILGGCGVDNVSPTAQSTSPTVQTTQPEPLSRIPNRKPLSPPCPGFGATGAVFGCGSGGCGPYQLRWAPYAH